MKTRTVLGFIGMMFNQLNIAVGTGLRRTFVIGAVAIMLFGTFGCDKLMSPTTPAVEEQVQQTMDLQTQQSSIPAEFQLPAEIQAKVDAFRSQMQEKIAGLRTQPKGKIDLPRLNASGSTLRVPTDFPTIQAAVDAASPGDKILVYPGTYNEVVTITTSGITLMSAVKHKAIVIGGFEVIGASDVEIENFDVRGGGPSGAALYAFQTTNVKFDDNLASGATFGIWIDGGSGAVLKNNHAFENSIGIYITNTDASFVKHNRRVNDNTLDGIRVENSTNGYYSENITNNNGRDGMTLINSTGTRISGDNFFNGNGRDGLSVVNSDFNKFGSDNTALNNGRYGVSLTASNNNLITKWISNGSGVFDLYNDIANIGNVFIKNNFGTQSNSGPPPPPVGTYSLTVGSVNCSEVPIAVSPVDNNSEGDGATSFTRNYNNNTVVTLTAPPTACSNDFVEWRRNGVFYSSDETTPVTMGANITMTAVYATPQLTECQDGLILGTAAAFAVLGGTTVTNTGVTLLNADLGVSPGTAITGFPPGVVNGVVHQNDAVAAQAQADLTTAYNDLAGRANNFSVSSDLGGLTLVPGVYTSNSSLSLASGTLTLDAQGDPNAVFIFRSATSLITGSNTSVVLLNGAQVCNIFWQVGSSATLGTNSNLKGSVVALTSITLNSGATLDGRALARNGAITLDSNTITP